MDSRKYFWELLEARVTQLLEEAKNFDILREVLMEEYNKELEKYDDEMVMASIDGSELAMKKPEKPYIPTEVALLVNTPQGSGKSITVLKTLLEQKKRIVYLVRNHKHIENNMKTLEAMGIDVKSYGILHYKGRFAKQDSTDKNSPLMCINPDARKLHKYYVPVQSILCDSKTGTCEHKKDCPYLQQKKYIKDAKGIFGAYEILRTPMLNNFNFDVLVLDEHPIEGLKGEFRFTIEDVKKLLLLLNDIFSEVFDETHCERQKLDSTSKTYRKDEDNLIERERYFGSLFSFFRLAAHALEKCAAVEADEIKDKTVKVVIDKQLRDTVKETISTIPKTDIEYLFNQSNPNYHDFFIRYMKHVRVLIKTKKMFRSTIDIIPDIVNTLMDAMSDSPTNVSYDIISKQFVYYNIRAKLPPEPTVFLDATGTFDFYSLFFSRKDIEEFKPNIPVERHILQISDGRYPKSSLFFKETRERVYDAIYEISKYHLDQGVKRIYYTTYLSFTNEINAIKADKKINGDFTGKSLQKYLMDKGLTADQINISYFEVMKGVNIKDLEKNGVLFVIGTPEPNIIEFRKLVSAFMEGIPPSINNTRTKDRLYYDDPRYMMILKPNREHTTEHTIERLRFLKGPRTPSGRDKVCYLFSSLPIEYKTKLTSLNGLLEHLGIKDKPNIINEALFFIQNKEPTYTEFYKKFTNKTRKDERFKNTKNLRDNLVNRGLVEVQVFKGKTKSNKKLFITSRGKRILTGK